MLLKRVWVRCNSCCGSERCSDLVRAGKLASTQLSMAVAHRAGCDKILRGITAA